MQRILKILSFICLACLIGGAFRLSGSLPADTSAYVEKKYSGWSGVLRGWIYSDWNCSGSFVSWLNSCAADFEKAHEGVYLEFETVSREALDATGIHPPDILIYSDGARGGGTAIALGAYIFAENPQADGTAIPAEYAAPMIAMHADEQREIEVPDSGIDLGLPATSIIEGVEIADDAFQRFVNGEIGRTIVNQSQLARLIALRDSGKGPDWKCVPQGEYSWCDQRLMLEVLEGDGERMELCGKFLQMLLEDEQQAKLASIGGFAATGISIYEGFSAYRPMEQQLLATAQLFPKSEHYAADFAGLVRKLYSGQVSREAAQGMLLQTCG